LEVGDRPELFSEKIKKTSDRSKILDRREIAAVARIESSLISGARKYLEKNGFIEVTVPHITKATGACENIATMFTVEFFGERKYLSQTGQLYLEVLTPYLERVWICGPSFRAEERVDSRHLCEFTLLELEFKGGFQSLLEYIEGTIMSMVQSALERVEDLELLGSNIELLKSIRKPFRKIRYSEAVDKLSEYGVRWGDDLTEFHEKRIVEMEGNRPVFVTHYPKKIKFFNMREDPLNSEQVLSADLLLPYSGEAVGAAEREYQYENIRRRLMESSMFAMLQERGGKLEDFQWYLDFYREKGGVQHSGCGIGVNRVSQFIICINDIRGSTVWPVNRESAF
jgi:asparaginyl-tRNA synthetase